MTLRGAGSLDTSTETRPTRVEVCRDAAKIPEYLDRMGAPWVEVRGDSPMVTGYLDPMSTPWVEVRGDAPMVPGHLDRNPPHPSRGMS
ncbi:hypothetical protein BN12_3710003 [Nostocoides japonicum T1-X7]|uniref:Uncharacterized protein n=1 Tax=Nostocoides japonicum T1-X7 TaxID=1194083 RepID=A0A077M416_9MICO|nr:hypothetical protein BN12_3710003 [Tetrasphaera japonica T1-X7]